MGGEKPPGILTEETAGAAVTDYLVSCEAHHLSPRYHPKVESALKVIFHRDKTTDEQLIRDAFAKQRALVTEVRQRARRHEQRDTLL
jgi:hypothetical protein